MWVAKGAQMSLGLRWTSLITLVGGLIIAIPAYAQDNGAVKVYRDQFIQLHARARTVLFRAEEQVRSAPAADSRAAADLREKTLALAKLVHALEEDAGRSYVEGLRRAPDSTKAGQSPQNPNKTLLFVESGCDQMDFILGAVDNYLETGDRSFLRICEKGR